MTWAKFDDRRHTNKKLNAACAIDPLKGLAVNGVDANGITYSSANETDGFVDDASLIQLMPGASKRLRTELTRMLVAVGRWTRDEERSGWWIVNYSDFNPAHADLEAKRVKDRERKAQQQRSTEGVFHSDSVRIPSGVRTDSKRTPSDPVPSRPVPSQSSSGLVSEEPPPPAELDSDDDETIWKTWAAQDRDRLIAETGRQPHDDDAWLAKVAAKRRERHSVEVAALLAAEPNLTAVEVIGRLELGEERTRPHPLDATAAAARELMTRDRSCPDCHGSGWVEDSDPVIRCEHRNGLSICR